VSGVYQESGSTRECSVFCWNGVPGSRDGYVSVPERDPGVGLSFGNALGWKRIERTRLVSDSAWSRMIVVVGWRVRCGGLVPVRKLG